VSFVSQSFHAAAFGSPRYLLPAHDREATASDGPIFNLSPGNGSRREQMKCFVNSRNLALSAMPQDSVGNV
jgi:hypothetical protein